MLLRSCLALTGDYDCEIRDRGLLPDAELGEVVKQSKDVDEPYNEHNYHNAVQNSLDLTLHRDETIDQPKQYADYADCENNRDKWHFMYSNSSSLFQTHESNAEQLCSRETVSQPRGTQARSPLKT